MKNFLHVWVHTLEETSHTEVLLLLWLGLLLLLLLGGSGSLSGGSGGSSSGGSGASTNSDVLQDLVEVSLGGESSELGGELRVHSHASGLANSGQGGRIGLAGSLEDQGGIGASKGLVSHCVLLWNSREKHEKKCHDEFDVVTFKLISPENGQENSNRLGQYHEARVDLYTFTGRRVSHFRLPSLLSTPSRKTPM
jgi:hypothetical protein